MEEISVSDSVVGTDKFLYFAVDGFSERIGMTFIKIIEDLSFVDSY